MPLTKGTGIMDGMVILLFAAALGVTPGLIAQKKGHEFLPWWLFGTLLFIVALPMAIMLEPNKPVERVVIRNCRQCGESLKALAMKCVRCGQAVMHDDRWEKAVASADEVQRWANENNPQA